MKTFIHTLFSKDTSKNAVDTNPSLNELRWTMSTDVKQFVQEAQGCL